MSNVTCLIFHTFAQTDENIACSCSNSKPRVMFPHLSRINHSFSAPYAGSAQGGSSLSREAQTTPLPSYLFQLFWGHPKVFSSQPR